MNFVSSVNPSTIPAEMRTILKVVINSLPSIHSKRSYHRGIRDFLTYWVEKGKPVPDKLFLQTYVHHLQDTGVGEASINVRITAIRKFAAEATDYNVWPPHVQTSLEKVNRIPVRGNHAGTWLTLEQAQKLINAPDLEKKIGIRDRAMLSVLLGCGLRISELVSITFDHIQQRNNVWVLANIVGKRNKVRTVVMPNWTKKALDAYIALLDFTSGIIFRAMYCDGTIRRDTLRPNSLWKIVKQYAAKSDLPEISPHDLRRTYAKLAYKNGAKLDQIQINLGHQSLTTTQKYLGLELDLNDGPGNYLDIRI